MPSICSRPALVAEIEEKRALLGHGDGVTTHCHHDGQLPYPSSGTLATTTARGPWVAPANRVAWTPPGFQHHHRAYGRTEVRVAGVSEALCASLPDRPTVFAVSPLLREALLALTSGRELQPEARPACVTCGITRHSRPGGPTWCTTAALSGPAGACDHEVVG